jgi:uroporphyrinogen decarboxylase
MTSRQRMLTAMRNCIPDRIPVAPDISNMIPCRLTGKKFWDIYLYQDPPLWRAYMDAAKYFGIDGWLCHLDGFGLDEPSHCENRDFTSETVIVEKTAERIVTRNYTQRKGQAKEWSQFVTVYPHADPPTSLLASKVGMDNPPSKTWPIEGVIPQKKGFALLQEAIELFEERGVVGISVGPPKLGNPDAEYGYSVYDYYDKYGEVKEWSVKAGEQAVNYLKRVLSGPVKPDFILTGGSGLLVFNTPDMIRELTLPAIKAITQVCRDAGVPSQIHCCGPERELIEMCALETDLSSINPLEIPPMGNCDLAEVKERFGKKLSLMGNLHTTEVMLRGGVKDVRRESLKAIRAAGGNGGFILSTGDQCGRDTPDENIREMVNVVNEFGVYPLDFTAIDREIKSLGK